MKLKKKNRGTLSDSYLRLSGVLLFVGLLITGTIMVSSAVATYTDTMKNTLLRNCQALTANIYDVFQDGEGFPEEEIKSLIRTAEIEYHYQVRMYDEKGVELYPGTDSGDDVRLLTPSIRSYLERDDYVEFGYYTEDAEQPQLCGVIRVYMESKSGEVTQYYVAALTDAGDVQEYTLMLTRNLIISLLIVMLVFMILFRIGAGKLDKQLAEIGRVTEKYAEGDFSEHVNLPEHATLYPFSCTLNRMAEYIEKNETTRRDFVANVSHELRTPMTTIGGFAEGILDGTIPEEQTQKYVRIIAEEIRRLRTLVNSMLNLSKFESGEMQLRITNVDIAKLLIKTVLMFEKRISDKHVEAEGLEDISLVVKADEDLMYQVLYNLIENAVKFVNEGGTISFSVREENDTAYIGIKNTGDGLAEDDLPKIFDRFYKTDTSRSKDKTGLGLGLSIARKIVHLHKGHIVVKSVQGEYTSFEVQLPVG